MKKNCKKNRQKIFHPKIFQKKYFRKFSVKFCFKIYLAIVVPQTIWGMPAKIWGV
jgi:hypothetical protein